MTYHFVYKTTNIINGKFYYGKHSASATKDDYLGSGKVLDLAIKKSTVNLISKEKLLSSLKLRKKLSCLKRK